MKRTEINRILVETEALLARVGVRLPPFCGWTPEKLSAMTSPGGPAREVLDRGLGWDVTDFGSGDFGRSGLTLVTLRNGTPESGGPGRQGRTAGAAGRGGQESAGRTGGLGGSRVAGGDLFRKTYAEKVLVVLPGQVTPAHFHHYKMEDIIVRGGGRLVVRVWNATEDDILADTELRAQTDGVERVVAAGGEIVLGPGESVTLPPRMYHAFWGHPADGPSVVGEVSKANDDHTDNRFLQPMGRFPAVEEDEQPYRWLVGDYARVLGK